MNGLLSMESNDTRSPRKRRRIVAIHSTSTPSKPTAPSPDKFDMDESLSTIAGENSDLNSTVQSSNDCTLGDSTTHSEDEDEVTLISD